MMAATCRSEGDEMQHSFDIDLAVEYGVLEAVILNNLDFWISKNEANEVNFHEGRYWTFNSVRAFQDLFPYATNRKIANALKKLEDRGVIMTGNFNKNPIDRTTWYTFTDYGMQIVHDRKREDFPKPKPKKVSHEGEFEIFWKAYPKKKSKGTAERAFEKAIKKTDLDTILCAIEDQKDSKQWQEKDGQFIPYPATWLNAECWKDEVRKEELEEGLLF